MNTRLEKYTPGEYNRKRLKPSEWIENQMAVWKQSRALDDARTVPVSICMARTIGSGALEIADTLADMIDYRVVDRDIIELMANGSQWNQRFFALYDEKYPGRRSEFLANVVREKPFLKQDFAKALVRTVKTLADSGPTIFVGRGAHLILPRKTSLNVLITSSLEYRIQRLCDILEIQPQDAKKRLKELDREQQKFFKNVFGPSVQEHPGFDLIIHRDYLGDPDQVAWIIAAAAGQKKLEAKKESCAKENVFV